MTKFIKQKVFNWNSCCRTPSITSLRVMLSVGSETKGTIKIKQCIGVRVCIAFRECSIVCMFKKGIWMKVSVKIYSAAYLDDFLQMSECNILWNSTEHSMKVTWNNIWTFTKLPLGYLQETLAKWSVRSSSIFTMKPFENVQGTLRFSGGYLKLL